MNSFQVFLSRVVHRSAIGVGLQSVTSAVTNGKIVVRKAMAAAVLLSLWGCAYASGVVARAPTLNDLATDVAVIASSLVPRAPATDDPESAVVRIEAVGTFEDVWEGLPYSGTGSGSGFLISPNGEILTNAHVVVGASLLRVFVPGYNDARAGRVVSIDECSDLALIKIDGANYPYLALAGGEPALQARVSALGYAHGRPKLATTRGRVVDVRAEGASGWAALGHTIQHSAQLHPGNSGGPLLADDSTVVGVNYSADEEGDAWAVPISVVTELLPLLRAGNTSAFVTGINGQAFTSLVSDVTGVFASSVASGSAADRAGVLPGDLVMKLERLSLAHDGTLKQYCDVLRSHAQSDVLSVQVYRRTQHVLLVGQLNGDRLAAVNGTLPEPDPPQSAPQPWIGTAIPELYKAGMQDLVDLAPEQIQNGLDTLVYLDDLREQPVGLTWGWCADSQTRLEQNWAHFSILFVADGQPYAPDTLFIWDSEDSIDVAGKTGVAAFCRTANMALDEWDTGVHRLVAFAYLDEPINDGWRDYYESDVHTTHYEIRVNQAPRNVVALDQLEIAPPEVAGNTAVPSGCVSVADAWQFLGQERCVYGNMSEHFDKWDAGMQENVYWIRFEETDDFYMLMYGGWSYDELYPACTIASGKIERLGRLTVMVLAPSVGVDNRREDC